MGKRKADAISPIKPQFIASTPAKGLRSKKVRFTTNTLPEDLSTTGLTPAVRRAGLATRKRRTSTPARLGYVPSSPSSEADFVQFTPLRQALDDRTKRRIRRHGLTDVVNEHDSERRENTHLRHEIRRKDRELAQMKEQLEEVQQQVDSQERASQRDEVQSRVDEIENELSTLRRSFGAVTGEENWDHVPRRSSGPGSEGGDTIQIYEDDTDPYQDDLLPPAVPVQDRVDATLMSLELASARQEKQNLLSSFGGRSTRSFDASDLNFADSPSRPKNISQAQDPMSRTSPHDIQKQLRAAKARADDAELALTALENEVRALGFMKASDPSAMGCLEALAGHFREIRLQLEDLVPGETVFSFNNPALFPELTEKLRKVISDLAARDAELKTLRNQEKSLRGNFDHALAAGDKAAKKVKELESAIEDAAEETLHIRMKSQQLERDLETSEADSQRLREALQNYRKEVRRLEDLITSVEAQHGIALAEVQATAQQWETTASDMDAKAAAETVGRQKAEESAVARLRRITELDESLSKMKDIAEQKEQQLNDLQGRHDTELSGVHDRNTTLANALTNANAEVEKLRTAYSKLEEQYLYEVQQGTLTVEEIQHQMIKAATRITERGKGYKRGSKVRLANWQLESDDYPVGEDGMPMTPASTVRFASPEEDDDREGGDRSSPASEHVPGSVEIGRGRKKQPLTPALGLKKGMGRRRYDSGVGMSPLGEESEGEDYGRDSGFVTPDLSSEADIDMGVEV